MAEFKPVLKSETGIDDIKRGVFAFLEAPCMNTIVANDTYQVLGCVLANSPLESFTFSTDPAIVYSDSEAKWFEIDWHAVAKVNATGKDIHVAMCHKPSGGVYSIIDSSISGTYLKSSNEVQPFNGTTVIQLTQGDSIQIRFKSDTLGDEVTFNHFVTSINMFFIN